MEILSRFFRLRFGAALMAVAAAPPAETSLPARAIVLVVAGWCAPCHGEIARLGEIASAAPGRSIRVTGLDRGAATRAMLAKVPPQHRWEPDSAVIARLRAQVFDRSAGLPYAIATDGEGRPCADLTLPLDRERTRDLVLRCTP